MNVLFLIIITRVLIPFHVPSQAPQCPAEYDSLLKKNVYLFVEKRPEYPGGDAEMTGFIMANFHYPKQEVFQASFQVQFVIDINGKMVSLRIQGKQPRNYTNAEKELIRVFGIMPKWKPGECDGKKVPVKVMMPLRF